jgi:sugar-specific transcriptional regulator TrmB
MEKELMASLGMNEKTAKIYLAGLALGTTTVQDLARKTGLKRPTVYLHLDELIKSGMFEVVPLNNKQYYRAAGPEIIESRMQKNLSTLRSKLPELVSMRADTMGKPQAVVLEGEEGVRRVYAEARKANSCCIWSNMTDLYTPLHEIYLEMFEEVKEKGIGMREIIADTKEAKRYSRFTARMCGPTYSARVATVAGLANDSFIYGNTVALFRLHELNLFVVRIEDKTIADSMRSMFEMAWKTARPFR